MVTPDFTFGNNDGVNGGIITNVFVIAGHLEIETIVPASVPSNNYQDSYSIADGLVATLPTYNRLTCFFMLLMKVSVVGYNYEETFEVELMQSKKTISISSEWEGKTVRVSYVLKAQDEFKVYSNIPSVYLSYTDIEFTLQEPKYSFRRSSVDSVELSSVATSGSNVSITALSALGTQLNLLGETVLEFPAAMWTPAIINVCDRDHNISAEEDASECRFLNRNSEVNSDSWYCNVRGIKCRGYKQGCGEYSPTAKCLVLALREDFCDVNGIITINDSDIEKILNTQTGYAVVPDTLVTEDGSAANIAFWASLSHASMFYCHKYEEPQQNLLPCYLSSVMEIPLLLSSGAALWRYVSSGVCDTTFVRKDHDEIVLKNTDICVANLNDIKRQLSRPSFGGEFSIPTPTLEPAVYTPSSLPDGHYDAYLYCINTSGQPVHVVVSQYTRADRTDSKRKVWTVPASAEYSWVKLLPEHDSRDFSVPHLFGGKCKIEVVVAPNITPAGTTIAADLLYDTSKEFAFKSLCIERVS